MTMNGTVGRTKLDISPFPWQAPTLTSRASAGQEFSGIFHTLPVTYPDLTKDVRHDDLGNRSLDELDRNLFSILLVLEQIGIPSATSAQELDNVVCLFQAKVGVSLRLLALHGCRRLFAASCTFVIVGGCLS